MKEKQYICHKCDAGYPQIGALKLFPKISVKHNFHGLATKRDITRSEENLFAYPKWDANRIETFKMHMQTHASPKSVVSASKSN